MLEWENDKPTVVALREVAAGYVDESILVEREHTIDELLEMETAAAGLQDDTRDRPISSGG
jgi:hypothetical protein